MAEADMNILPGTVKPVLYGLGVMGTLGTWGRSAADGTLGHLFRALHGNGEAPYILPGTECALKTSFTGLYWPVDYLLDVLVIFFWEAIDGSHPAASAVGIYFLGQYFAVLVGFYADYLRAGNGSSVLKPTLWALSFQLATVGSVGWIWALSFVTSSPTTSVTIPRDALKHASLAEPRSVYFVLSALFIGFCVPAVAMGLPSPLIVSNGFQQWALVTWNMFPLNVLLILKAFNVMGLTVDNQQPAYGNGKYENGSFSQEYLRSVRIVRVISLTLSVAGHLGIISISIAATLFPTVFHSMYRQELTPQSLFVPPTLINHGRTVGDGVRSFLLWDQIGGYSVLLFVALLQLRSATRATGAKFNWLKAIIATTLSLCAIGPGSTYVGIGLLYDELLFGVGL